MAVDIKTLTQDEILEIINELGEPKFRAKQIYEWLHTRNVSSYDEMTNLPKTLRETLSTKYPLETIQMIDKSISTDGTRKYVFKLSDGALVETVGILAPKSIKNSSSELSNGDSTEDIDISHVVNDRLTVCFSTQSGCPMGCTFFATGKEGFTRNLSSSEIVDQITAVKDDFNNNSSNNCDNKNKRVIRVSNVVAMGQGEPFLNYEELIKALHRINNDPVLEIGARHITISSCGIINGIEQLAEEPEQYRLAISLHSANQNTRNTLMPSLSNQPLKRLKEALLDYNLKKNRRITFEYLMIDGVNDNQDDLYKLIDFCEGLLCHINLIPLNQVTDSEFQPSSDRHMKYWEEELKKNGIASSIRYSKGSDISGACGQLKASVKKD